VAIEGMGAVLAASNRCCCFSTTVLVSQKDESLRRETTQKSVIENHDLQQTIKNDLRTAVQFKFKKSAKKNSSPSHFSLCAASVEPKPSRVLASPFRRVTRSRRGAAS